MMRYFYCLAILCLALMAGCGGCEQKEPYTGDPNPLWDLHKVYGRVKTVKTEYFEPIMKEGKWGPGSHVGDNITWDSMDVNGRLVYTKVMELDGRLKKTEHFTYNPKGEIIAIETRNAFGTPATNQDIYFNDKGQKIKQVVVMHLPDGDQSFWRTWEYDSTGQITQSLVIRSDSTLDNREVLTYYENDSGKIHTHSLYVGYDSLKYRNKYVYNKDGRDSILHRYRVIEGDSIGYHSRYEYTYDEHGNELTRNLISAEGAVRATSKYEYTFDHHNNWTQRIEIVDGEPNVVKVRTFTYYDEEE